MKKLKIFVAEENIINEMIRQDWHRGFQIRCNQFYSLFDDWMNKTKDYHSELELIKADIRAQVKWVSPEKEDDFFKELLETNTKNDLKNKKSKWVKEMENVNQHIFNCNVNKYYKLKIEAGEELLKLFLYSEIVLKLRSSQTSYENGYSFDGVGLLRAALELNNGLLAFRETRDIKFPDYLEILLSFSLSSNLDLNKLGNINNKRVNIERKIKANLFSKFSDDDKQIYGHFMNSFHSSIHSSTSNLGMRVSTYVNDGSMHNLFVPEYSEVAIGNFINIQFMLILITLKNLINEEFWVKKEELESIVKEMVSYYNLETRVNNNFNKEAELINLLNRRY